jgi:hypothetical protein
MTGVLVDHADNNSILGNLIGTDPTGTVITVGNDSFRGNVKYGVAVRFSSDNIIGGDVVSARNVISGNGNLGEEWSEGGAGVLIEGSTSQQALRNQIYGNYIGTEATGMVGLSLPGKDYANDSGIELLNASNTRIGYSTSTPGTAPGNLISGNKWGIYVLASA